MQRSEQETHVSYGVDEEVVRIYSTVPKHMRKLRSRDTVVIIRDDGDMVTAEIPRDLFDPFTGFKRKRAPQSPEQVAASVRRLREAREAQNES